MENNAPNQGLPLVFMYEGRIYSKEVSGSYHIFLTTTSRTPSNSIDAISIDQAKKIFADSKFISSIIVLTNDVNLKV